MVELVWLISAKEDLKEIYDFVASDSKKYAKHQINHIQRECQHKILKPSLYSRPPASFREKVYFFKERSLYYLITKDTVS